ncbi:ATP-dependent zinc metalloprotease YME1 isoform X1 [Apis mellifera caucasica]|uniref:ATP-dependent zinc metalloprotease YME1 homolog isoform X1 n=1 Tax=Apis mellifera TaxID=7460 RepID=A0A7M7TEZ1_APIME|nr:ATP-dependent zinc metalloprotease YME1 homolog isoform X1 [Apis mellifera]KAG6797997.1 ATP-dependent zinc metalloprotease YME1 isoform X1 [Apis mellifera caucasica]|eukprot:XP_392703.4 ATP-dependent zinc metalloprotease YME1 homolog isoform X1 [Apis mellifera]
MFSFQPHNQVLYHLAQLTSVVSPKSTSFSVKVKKQNEFKKSMDDISFSNFSEATKNYIDKLIGKLKTCDVIAMFDIKTNNILVVLDKFSTKICRKNLEKNNKWKISDISELNFKENTKKYHNSYYQCTKEIILPTLPRKSSNYYIQIRNFRTKRNVNVELEKKASFVNKFKNLFGHFSGTNIGYRANILKEKDLTAIKNLFNNQTSVEEYRKIILAFIEGYEAGLARQTYPYFGWFKVMCTLITGTIFVMFWYGVYLVGSGLRFSMDGIKFRPETTDITFNDVKGVAEAKQELSDIVEFLKNPEKFSALGAKLPKGVLLVGPPGTGKTLLARAVAGEAGVPFFHAAGPEFEEILVGQGARRMRDLFKAAKEKAPAVIFIDEIDSVGAKRTNSALHPYANQTVNQLLTEMDGFLQNEGVIVLGATNRRDDLDKALMRPGRFDVEVVVDIPDYSSRKEIFDLYLSKILTRDVDTSYLAKCTVGFTGADIENMVNQAALRAAINDAEYVSMKHLEYARDKLIMGPERKLKINDTETNSITAYHEAGHALVAYYTKDAPALHKITIMPHGHSLGHTAFLSNKDQIHITKSKLLAQMDSAMGGRAAEELIFGPDKITAGAQSDFKAATSIAEEMVNLYGMSEKVGFGVRMGNRTDGYPSGPNANDLSDNEVKRLLQESYERAKMILQKHAKELKKVADALLKYETLSSKDVEAVINGEKISTETLKNQSRIIDPSEHVL